MQVNDVIYFIDKGMILKGKITEINEQYTVFNLLSRSYCQCTKVYKSLQEAYLDLQANQNKYLDQIKTTEDLIKIMMNHIDDQELIEAIKIKSKELLNIHI